MSRKPRTRSTGFRQTLALVGPAAAIAIVLLSMPSVSATEPQTEPVIRVEEDWTLILNEPDNALHSPQFHTVMSPFSHLDWVYLQATWNYWEQPSFQAGGLQLQAWGGDFCVIRKNFLECQQLSTDAETITWTQSLATNGEVLSFQINNAQSQTWGAFGGDNTKLQGFTHIPDLNGYSPEVSAANSWVTYGSNRVDLLMITQVRYYGGSGLLYTDTTPRVVSQLDAE